jgi:hypothetical protein
MAASFAMAAAHVEEPAVVWAVGDGADGSAIARRLARRIERSRPDAFLYLGELIEFGETGTLFTAPFKRQTEDYITGRFG